MYEMLARAVNEERRRSSQSAAWREYCSMECNESRVHHPRSAD